MKKAILSVFLIAGIILPSTAYAFTTTAPARQPLEVENKLAVRTSAISIKAETIKHGIVVKDNTNYILLAENDKFNLCGNISGLEKLVGKRVEVNGYITKLGIDSPGTGLQTINVISFKDLTGQVLTYTGYIELSYNQGRHYELVTPNGRYILKGNDSMISKNLYTAINVSGIELNTRQNVLLVRSIHKNYGHISVKPKEITVSNIYNDGYIRFNPIATVIPHILKK